MALPPSDLLLVFNAQPGATLLLSPAWVILGASDDYLAATLTERATLVGQYIFAAFPDNPAAPEANGVANVRASLERVLATRQPHTMAPQHYDVPDPTRPGHFLERHWQPRHTPVLDAEGEVQFIIQSVQDITRSRQAEQQLRESQAGEQVARADAQRQAQEREHFYQMFAQTPAALCVQRGPEHRYEYANAAYRQFFPGRELIGLAVAEALPETVASGVVALLDHVYQTGETYHGYELPLLIAQPEGPPKQMYFTFTYQAFRENGEIVGISTFAYDVAEQVQARQQLEQREASFRTMADAAPAMLWVTDPDGQCTYLNAQWYLFTGQTETQALGLGWTTAVHPDDADLAAQMFLAANARREPFHGRYRLRRHDGVYRWATDTGWPRFTATGEYAGIVGTVIDIHEQHLAEQELQASNEQLRRTNVDLDNFIYTASHDLKAPISNIEGLLYLLQEELPPAVACSEEVGPILTRMLEAAERFKRTIHHLTEVSKLQKEHTPAPALVNLAAVVEDVRQDLGPLLQATGGKLVVDVPALPPVPFAEKNLRSVVYNLLSNAVKYHSPVRPLRVDVRAHGHAGHTVLEVHDNGLGIDPAHLPRLFTMFQRFHDHVEGTGIGLYMVKRMVENAGGRLEVHSQLGAGTTFFVFLPHADRAAGQPFPAYLPT